MKLDIPDHYQDVGILFSGGIDSTLALYMVAKQYPKKTIWAFSAGCSYIDNRVHLKYSNQVMDMVTRLVDETAIDYHITTFHNDRTGHHCQRAMEQFKNTIDCWVIGQNSAPPKGSIGINKAGEHLDLFDFCHLEHRKNITETVWQTKDGFNIYKPFLFMDKQEEILLYHKFGIFDALIPLTRSCPVSYTRAKSNEFVEQCGNCYWCLERQWGLNVRP